MAGHDQSHSPDCSHPHDTSHAHRCSHSPTPSPAQTAPSTPSASPGVGPGDEFDGESEADFVKKHPHFLSQQSRRAFLGAAGVAGAAGLNFAASFLRGDREAAQAETLLAADLIRNARNIHTLKATPQTCFWGFFDKTLPPVLTIDPGDIVYVEALTHHAGDAPDLLMDAGVKAVYDQVNDRGPGVHIMTGPISVRGAEPGDTLMVRILKTEPRLPYGSNIASPLGLPLQHL